MTSIIKIDPNQVISRMKCELPEGVTGIGYSQQEKAVVFYRAEDGLFGFVGNDHVVRNAVRRLEVKSPSGICCDPYGLCVMQFSSDMLWNFDQSYKAGRRIFGSGLFKTLSGSIPQNASSFAPYGICRTSANKIVVAVPWGNRLWTFYDQKIGEQIGSGKKGFASSSSLQSSMLDAPSGVCFDEGSGLMFVSDTGNSVVRVYKDFKETAFIGVPGMKGTGLEPQLA